MWQLWQSLKFPNSHFLLSDIISISSWKILIPPHCYTQHHCECPLTGCCGTCVWSRSSRGSCLLFGAGRLLSVSCTLSPPPAPHRPLWTGTAHSGIPATRAAPQLKTHTGTQKRETAGDTQVSIRLFDIFGLSLLNKYNYVLYIESQCG